MKKHWLKICGGIFALALLLTGCAPLSDVKNNNESMLYYGGCAVTVSDYTFFANAYTDYTDAAKYDYNGNAKISYLARMNNSTMKTEGKDFSPNNVEKVAEKIAGYKNQDMFVYGDYIYFTSMNEYQYTNPQRNDYSLVTLWRYKLNGDDKTALYTTQYFTNGKYAPVGDKENGYYWICFTGPYDSSKEHSGKIFSIKVTNGKTSENQIADKVLSCAFANVNEDGNNDRIFYSKTEKENNRDVVKTYSMKYDGSGVEKYRSNETIVFVDKIQDRVFFTKDNGTSSSSSSDDAETFSPTYYRDVNSISADEDFESANYTFSTESISQIWYVWDGEEEADANRGYIYMSSNSIEYIKSSSMRPSTQIIPKSETLTTGDGIGILFVDRYNVYYSNSTTISTVSILPDSGKTEIEPKEIVTMSSIQTGQYGYDGKYIYFFATLEDVETEETLSEDSNLYMYRVAKEGGDYQLIAKTMQTRTPKKQDEK